jgi:hypothetical protein
VPRLLDANLQLIPARSGGIRLQVRVFGSAALPQIRNLQLIPARSGGI